MTSKQVWKILQPSQVTPQSEVSPEQTRDPGGMEALQQVPSKKGTKTDTKGKAAVSPLASTIPLTL